MTFDPMWPPNTGFHGVPLLVGCPVQSMFHCSGLYVGYCRPCNRLLLCLCVHIIPQDLHLLCESNDGSRVKIRSWVGRRLPPFLTPTTVSKHCRAMARAACSALLAMHPSPTPRIPILVTAKCAQPAIMPTAPTPVPAQTRRNSPAKVNTSDRIQLVLFGMQNRSFGSYSGSNT
jgi:hypothetical protein